MGDDPLQIGLNALSNSSRKPVERSDVLAILATEEGQSHLVRALFGDCSIGSLDRMAIVAGLSRAQVRAAYRVARERHGERNADFEAPEGEISHRA